MIRWKLLQLRRLLRYCIIVVARSRVTVASCGPYLVIKKLVWFSPSLVHVYWNMVSEVKFTFWRVQLLLRIVNAVGGTLMLFPSFVRNFEANCPLKVWEDAGRQRPRGVECANSAPSASTLSTAQAQAILQVYPQLIASNFLLPSSMKCQGDVVGNWEFFKQQWSGYEIATGLDKREESIRLATLRSAMGRECLQILLNLNLSEEDKKKIHKCLEALEKYFKPTRNVVYERYVFNTC